MKTYQPESQEDWIAFRATKLTSTELAKLHCHKTASAWSEVRDVKESGQKFYGNQYTDWGHGREPKIAEIVTGSLDQRLHHNTEPQLIFMPDDERLSCTPDMYGDGLIGEIKTSKSEFTGGRFHDWAPDLYFCQIQANMHYTGTDQCVLVVEYYDAHEGDDGELVFTPTGIDYQYIDYHGSFVDDLMGTAVEWHAWLEGTTPEWMGELTSLEAADDVEELVAQLAEADQQLTAWKNVQNDAREKLLAIVGATYKGHHAGHTIAISTPRDSKVFDSAAFKKDHAELYKEYSTKTRKGTPRIRLTKETS